ncbi:hypothetical protein H0H93_009068 [Arthromyces matolae]|nr:hypothetical protein H0H93_009068 [Arthromyces matolae]
MGNSRAAKRKRNPTSSRTGQRNVAQAKGADISDAENTPITITVRPRPKPRPLKKYAKDPQEPTADHDAAVALVSLQTQKPISSINRIANHAVEQWSDAWLDPDVEDEIDQLLNSDSSSQNEDDDLEMQLVHESDELPVFDETPTIAFDEDDDDMPPFDIPFEVAFNGATRDLEGVDSSTSFDSFLSMVAKAMETRLHLLSHIAYIPSYKPRNPKPVPKLLESVNAWNRLISDVRDYIATCKAKNKGKGTVKPFSIMIVDTSGGDKETNKKGNSKNLRKNEALSEAQAEVPTSVDALKDIDHLKRLESTHHCATCNRACTILNNGEHYNFTHADLALWITLLNKHQATYMTVPEALKLDVGRQRTAKKVVPTTPDPFAMFTSMMTPFAQVMAANLTPRYPITPNTPSPATMPVMSVPRIEAHEIKRSAEDDDIEPECPDLMTWLRSLDLDPTSGKRRVRLRHL